MVGYVRIPANVSISLQSEGFTYSTFTYRYIRLRHLTQFCISINKNTGIICHFSREKEYPTGILRLPKQNRY